MNGFRNLLIRLSASASLLTLLFLLCTDAATNVVNPLPVFFPRIFRDLNQMAMVSKLPEFLHGRTTPDVLLLGSSMILFPAVRCDDAVAGQKDRYDPWYFNIHILGYARADYLQSLLSKKTGRTLSVANLGIAAAMVSDSFMIFKKAVSFGKKPAVVVVAVSPRDFLDREHRQPEKTAAFQVLSDFTSAGEFLAGKPSFEDTVDFFAKASCHLYKTKNQYRDCLVRWTADLTNRPISLYLAAQSMGRQASASPQTGRGENSPGSRQSSITCQPDKPLFEPQHVDPAAARAIYNKQYLPPDMGIFEKQSSYMRQLLSLAKKEHIGVVLVDTPISTDLLSVFPDSTVNLYRQRLGALATEFGATLLRPQDQKDYTDQDFEDALHMNASGGRKFYAALVDTLTGDQNLNSQLCRRRETSSPM